MAGDKIQPFFFAKKRPYGFSQGLFKIYSNYANG